jgi:predicted aconitase
MSTKKREKLTPSEVRKAINAARRRERAETAKIRRLLDVACAKMLKEIKAIQTACPHASLRDTCYMEFYRGKHYRACMCNDCGKRIRKPIKQEG